MFTKTKANENFPSTVIAIYITYILKHEHVLKQLKKRLPIKTKSLFINNILIVYLNKERTYA